MAAFRYRLQALLDRARTEERHAVSALAAAQSQLRRVREDLAGLEIERRRALAAAGSEPERRTVRAGEVTFAVEACERFATAARGKEREALRLTDAARRAVLEHRRRRDALSRHRERCAAAFAARLERAAESELEEQGRHTSSAGRFGDPRARQ